MVGFQPAERYRQPLFEGVGDGLFDDAGQVPWLGHGHRSDAGTAPELEQALGITVRSLRLVDLAFYHLDTCFCPLDGGALLYVAGVFDAAANACIEEHYPARLRIAVSRHDAGLFACNAVSLGHNVVLHSASAELQSRLAALGYTVMEVGLGEFHKSGGSAKCLTLKLPAHVVGLGGCP